MLLSIQNAGISIFTLKSCYLFAKIGEFAVGWEAFRGSIGIVLANVPAYKWQVGELRRAGAGPGW